MDPVLVYDALWERPSELVHEVDGERVFAHALVRDAAYEGLAFRRRRELHSWAAKAIERRSEGTDLPVEVLSVHWFAAERWDRAWECSRQAGEHAAGLYANSDAATHFRRALDAARQLRRLPPVEVALVAEQLGDVCERSGTYDRARTAYEQASRRLKHNVDQARLLRKVGDLHERRGRYATALRCYTRAGHYLSTEGSDELVERCEIELAASGVRHRHFRLRDSMALAEAATEDATRAGYRKGLAHSLFLRHINSVYLNEPNDASWPPSFVYLRRARRPGRASGKCLEQPRYQRPVPGRVGTSPRPLQGQQGRPGAKRAPGWLGHRGKQHRRDPLRPRALHRSPALFRQRPFSLGV